MKSIIFLAALILFLICLLFAMSQVRGEEIDDLVPFIIQVESGGDPHAVGKAGEIGLCQISSIVLEEYNQRMQEERTTRIGRLIHLDFTPIEREKELERVFPKYNFGDLYNPSINVKITKWYLDRLRGLYIPPEKYSVELLLACYNAGPTRMRKLKWNWKKAPKSTLRYIRKIMRLYK